MAPLSQLSAALKEANEEMSKIKEDLQYAREDFVSTACDYLVELGILKKLPDLEEIDTLCNAIEKREEDIKKNAEIIKAVVKKGNSKEILHAFVSR